MKKLIVFCAVLVVLAMVTGSAFAIDWGGGTADFNLDASWSGGVKPTSTDSANFTASDSDEATLSVAYGAVSTGTNSSWDKGTLNIDGGSLIISSSTTDSTRLEAADSSSGTMNINIDDGSLTVNGRARQKNGILNVTIGDGGTWYQNKRWREEGDGTSNWVVEDGGTFDMTGTSDEWEFGDGDGDESTTNITVEDGGVWTMGSGSQFKGAKDGGTLNITLTGGDMDLDHIYNDGKELTINVDITGSGADLEVDDFKSQFAGTLSLFDGKMDVDDQFKTVGTVVVGGGTIGTGLAGGAVGDGGELEIDAGDDFEWLSLDLQDGGFLNFDNKDGNAEAELLAMRADGRLFTSTVGGFIIIEQLTAGNSLGMGSGDTLAYVSNVPEPTTMSLLLLGAVFGLAAFRRRSRSG